MSTIFVVIAIVAVVAFVLLGLFVLRSKSEVAKENQQPDASKDESKNDKVRDLLRLNLDVRKAGLGKKITNEVETVIDSLISIFPKIDAHECASGEFSWTVNRIAAEYLPNKCLLPFIKLEGENRKSSADALSVSLQALFDELRDIEQLLAQNDQSQFDNKSKFLKAKFNPQGNS
jgi:hypothetical protein